MDNKLIDSDKVAQWVREQEAGGRKVSSYTFTLALKDGLFSPDPIPLPTIKPGDRKYITSCIVNMDGELFFNISGVYGHFDWQGLHEFIKRYQDNDGPYEMTKIAIEHPNKEILFEFELTYIEPEHQYNFADSPPFVLPGYYQPTNITVTGICDLEVSHD
ncbi:hypothetical protein D3C76_454990 [compost metagenome]